mgnify:CR=1 FL=1
MVTKIWPNENPHSFFTQIIAEAIAEEASDIHITPQKDLILIKFRRAWELVNIYELTKEFYSQIVNIIKTNSMIWQKSDGDPQDGKIHLKVNSEEKKLWINLRISILPSLFGENVVIRILVEDTNKLDIEKLWFVWKNLEDLKSTKDLMNGLVLVAWSTWAGKTTTIYSLLAMFDPANKSIHTIEDPIEYQIDGYVQSQIKYDGSEKEYNQKFNKRIKWLLRQDPDIIMVGELREQESASLCLEAATTWQIVFGSIHTNSALWVLARLRQLGVKPYLISAWLKYIVYQKLVKRVCPHCAVKKDMTYNDIFKSDLNRLVTLPWVENWQLLLSSANSDGCDKCKNWYNGVTLITEVIKVDEKLSQLIFEDKSTKEIKEYLISKNHIWIFEDALLKSINWLVDMNEVFNLKN